MSDYKAMYFTSYSAMCDAVDALDGKNYGVAMEILKDTMKALEEIYISQENT